MKQPKFSRLFRKPRLLQTTAARLALRYLLIYAAVLALISITVLWSASRQVDDKLRNELITDLGTLKAQHEQGGFEALAAAIAQREITAGKQGRFYLLESKKGKRLAGNIRGGPDDDEVPSDGKVHTAWIDDEEFPRGMFDDDTYLPFIAHEFADGSRLLLARDVEQSKDLQELAELMLEAFAFVLLLSLLISITLGRSILKRMDTISRTAGDIMAGDLSQRIPVSSKDDEFDDLATRLNEMLDKVQQLIKGMREVTDNVAHDLRSPLTRLRNRLEVTLLEPRSPDTYREAIDQSINDADGLIKTFNALLGIAQTEAGNHRTEWGPVDINELAEGLADLYGPLAEDKEQTLEFIHNSNATINGSRHLLAQTFGNLIENAIKYTPEAGIIKLQVAHNVNFVEVIISDSGPGIPVEDRNHVFERFVRLDASRHTTGNGLGLSLVKAVCKLHKGTIELSDNQPGLVVRIKFPITQPEKKPPHTLS